MFNDIEVIVRMSLILNDTAKELLEFVTDIYDVMEKKLLANLDQINIEQATLIAHGYGVDRGSKELFNALEALVFKELDSLEITDLKGIMYGFLFTYRISEENTTAILDKASSFAPQ